MPPIFWIYHLTPIFPDKYELFGLINHVGDKSSGHYFTYIKHMNYWLVYDDAMKKKNIKY